MTDLSIEGRLKRLEDFLTNACCGYTGVTGEGEGQQTHLCGLAKGHGGDSHYDTLTGHRWPIEPKQEFGPFDVKIDPTMEPGQVRIEHPDLRPLTIWADPSLEPGEVRVVDNGDGSWRVINLQERERLLEERVEQAEGRASQAEMTIRRAREVLGTWNDYRTELSVLVRRVVDKQKDDQKSLEAVFKTVEWVEEILDRSAVPRGGRSIQQRVAQLAHMLDLAESQQKELARLNTGLEERLSEVRKECDRAQEDLDDILTEPGRLSVGDGERIARDYARRLKAVEAERDDARDEVKAQYEDASLHKRRVAERREERDEAQKRAEAAEAKVAELTDLLRVAKGYLFQVREEMGTLPSSFWDAQHPPGFKDLSGIVAEMRRQLRETKRSQAEAAIERVRQLGRWFSSRQEVDSYGGATVADLIQEALDDDPDREGRVVDESGRFGDDSTGGQR